MQVHKFQRPVLITFTDKVIQWSSNSQTSPDHLSFHSYHLYNASSSRSPQFDLIHNNTAMQLDSLKFQEVSEIGTALQMKVVVRSEIGVIIKQWLSLVEDMASSISPNLL